MANRILRMRCNYTCDFNYVAISPHGRFYGFNSIPVYWIAEKKWVCQDHSHPFGTEILDVREKFLGVDALTAITPVLFWRSNAWGDIGHSTDYGVFQPFSSRQKDVSTNGLPLEDKLIFGEDLTIDKRWRFAVHQPHTGNWLFCQSKPVFLENESPKYWYVKGLFSYAGPGCVVNATSVISKDPSKNIFHLPSGERVFGEEEPRLAKKTVHDEQAEDLLRQAAKQDEESAMNRGMADLLKSKKFRDIVAAAEGFGFKIVTTRTFK